MSQNGQILHSLPTSQDKVGHPPPTEAETMLLWHCWPFAGVEGAPVTLTTQHSDSDYKPLDSVGMVGATLRGVLECIGQKLGEDFRTNGRCHINRHRSSIYWPTLKAGTQSAITLVSYLLQDSWASQGFLQQGTSTQPQERRGSSQRHSRYLALLISEATDIYCDSGSSYNAGTL